MWVADVPNACCWRLREGGGQLVLCRLGPHVPLIFTPFPERQREEPNRLAPFLFLDDE